MQVYSRDDAHVPLAPLAVAVGDLAFYDLEGVEADVCLGHAEGFAEGV